ncbi:MAG: transglutaminase domain-containing protein, partial [Chitinophagia bacterium]|nr:transglutaminase domain-containing protein [Chitinophagia bacterium]
PNPLYLTAYYFTKFDTATETFERDSLIPKNDLFLPDPSKIPLFGTVIDTNVIRNSLGYIARDIVDVEIYNCKLSPKTYLAPNVGFFVQPITVEKDFRQKFVSAYRAKSYVSTLNSAYFVYNVDTPAIRNFQEARFRILREVKNYYGVDSTFLAYYTRMPQNKKFAYIDTLAHLITDTAATPVDKVLAIKNYFLSKDDNGKPLYKYTDNPGEPDIPSASKLMYFLKQSHKGYCAYYAGATLFMLRAVGIPSRITVGFLTEDRSDKNKGWYWYYANQAHAWVQVYFPGYGWLDFDNTVGNTDENRPTPQPDGTPPMQPPKAWFAAEGKVESVDTVRKTAVVTVKKFVFQDKEYVLKQPTEVSADLKVATIYKDSLAIPLNKVSKGEEGTLVSYAEDMKTIQVKDEVSAEEVMRVIPKPTPI